MVLENSRNASTELSMISGESRPLGEYVAPEPDRLASSVDHLDFTALQRLSYGQSHRIGPNVNGCECRQSGIPHGDAQLGSSEESSDRRGDLLLWVTVRLRVHGDPTSRQSIISAGLRWGWIPGPYRVRGRLCAGMTEVGSLGDTWADCCTTATFMRRYCNAFTTLLRHFCDTFATPDS